MSIDDKLTQVSIRSLLSTLWIFVLLNIAFRDIHELFRAGQLEEMIAGNVNGTQITEELMLLGGIMIEIPIAMVLLSKLLPYRSNRWANLIASLLMVVIAFGNPPRDLDDFWFLAMEVIALLLIIWYAWRWSHPEYRDG